MNDLIQKYKVYIENKGLSKNTIEAYIRDLDQYVEFITNRDEDINLADEITINAYIQKLMEEKKSIASINRKMASIRNFYKYLNLYGYTKETPSFVYELPKSKKEIPITLTVDEIDRLLSTPNIECDKGIRDRAMLEIMYATGIKVSELLNLRLLDLNLKMQYIICNGSKKRQRIIPLGSLAIKYMEQYLKVRGNLGYNNENLLFFNNRGKKMTRQGFWKIVKEYAREANINKSINLYTLRHSFAVHLLENGADIKSVQELLGHADLSATERYSYITKKNRLKEVYTKAHPRA